MKNYDEKEKRTLAVYIFIFLLLVAGIIASGYISYRNFEREFRHQAENQLSAIAELKVNELVNWRKERLSDAGFLYHDPAFSALVERYFENPDDSEARAQLLSRLGYYRVYNQYDKVRLLDVTGAERLSNTAPDPLDSHLTQDIIACLRSGKVTFFDFHRDTGAGDAIHLSVLVPIFADGSDSRPLGVLALGINPQTYLYPYIQNWPIPSDTAETLLVRREGEDVLFLNELRFGKKAALNLRFPLTSTDIPAVKAVLGQTGVVEGTDYRGEPVLADVRAVPGSPWFLISKMDTAEVYAPLRARLWQTLLITGMAIFMAGAGMALLWRQQRIIFYRAKAEVAEALRESEQNLTDMFQTVSEGIAYTTLAGQVLFINRSLEQIIGIPKEQIIGKNILGLAKELLSAENIKRVSPVLVGLEGGEIPPFEVKYKNKILEITTTINRASGRLTGMIRDITERRQAEEALKRSESFSRSIIENEPECIKVVGAEGILKYMNPAGLAMIEVEDLALVAGQSVYPIVVPEHREAFIDLTKKVLRGERGNLQFEIIGLKGTRRWLDTHAVPLYDDQGNVEALLGLTRDITERKRSEETLKENEAIFSSFLEHSPVYVFFKDKNIRSLKLSKNYEQMLGMPISDLLGKTMDDLFPSDLAKSMVADDLRTLNEGKRITVVEELNGHIYETTKFPVLKDGEPYILAGFTLDITERKQAEERLRQSEEQYRYLFENNPHPMWAYDLKTMKFLAVNDAAVDKYGYSRDEFMDMTIADIRPAEDVERLRNDLAKPRPALQHSGGWRHRLKNGTVIDVEISSHTLNLTGHEAALVVAQDITERKRAEEALHQRNKHLLALQKTALELVSQLDLDILLENIVRRAGQIMGTDSGYLDLVEPMTGQLIPRIGLGALAESLQHTVQPGEGLAGIVWQTGKPFIVNDYDQWAGRIGSFTSGKIRAAIGVPLLSGDNKMLGVLGLAYGPDTTKTFGDEDVTVLEQFAQLVAIAIMNASLFATAQQELAERKRVEEALRESEERLRLAVSAGRMGTWDRNFLSGKLNWSVECKAMFGLAPEVEMNDERFMQALHPEDREPTDLAIREALEKQADFDTEYRVIWPDGTIHWIAAQGHGYYNEAGQATHMAGVTFDITARKRTEEALLESEERFRTHYDNATIGLYRTTPDGRILMLNPAGVQMLGFDSFDEIAKRNLEDAGFEAVDTRREFREILEREGVVIGLENKWIRKDGSTIFVRESAKAFRDENGKVVYYDGSFEDVSGRVQAEAALRKSEELYRKMNQNSPLGMHFYNLMDDDQLIFTGANPAADKLLGVDNSQFIGKTIGEAFPSLIQTEVPQRYRDAAANGTPWSTEQITYDDGWISGAFEVRAFQTTPGSMVAVFADITARKKAEEEIRHHLNRLTALNKTALKLQRVYTLQVLTSEVIKSLEMILNYTYGAVLLLDESGQRLIPFALSTQGKNEDFLLRDKKYIESRNIYVGKGITGWVAQTGLTVRVGDVLQDTRYVGIRDNIRSELCVPLKAEDRVIGVINVETDQVDAYSQTDESVLETVAAQVSIAIQNSRLFEQVQVQTAELERRVIERTAQLENTNRELEAFSYSVSHDLRAPLRGIDGWSQALLEDYYEKLDEQGRLYINRVRSETQHMGQLIDNMLQLSRLTRAEMFKEQVDLSAIAQTIVERLKQDDPQRQVDFNIQAGLTAEGDSHLLESVLANLLGNAFKFTGKRADARIEFGSIPRSSLPSPKERWAGGEGRVFFVRDNGAGFDMAYSQKMFGAFQRMHKASEFPGTGIGLATVQRIIHRHGGHVWAEAEVERGATFYFTLG